jgi:NAD(P)-dependent dehydrogenase (short-subunit alcohol dehydrogenase family)
VLPCWQNGLEIKNIYYRAMAKIFITGSADGLGQLSAKLLVKEGHEVVLHARNSQRAGEAFENVRGAQQVLTADLSDIEETKKLADDVNALGTFDAIIHNAGVYRASAQQIIAVNTLAPYILTALIKKPKRLVYLSSGMHLHGHLNLDHLKAHNNISYSDSKLHVLTLCMAVSRLWKNIYANAVDPGWVPTKMGGSGAPDDLQKGYETQSWLAVSNDDKAKVSGFYFYHQQQKHHHPDADDLRNQEKLLQVCEEITGIPFPR